LKGGTASTAAIATKTISIFVKTAMECTEHKLTQHSEINTMEKRRNGNNSKTIRTFYKYINEATINYQQKI